MKSMHKTYCGIFVVKQFSTPITPEAPSKMTACSYSSQVCRINRRQTRIVTAGASMKTCDSDAGCYDYGVTPITVHVRHRATTGDGHLTAAAVRTLSSIINTPCALSRRSRLTECLRLKPDRLIGNPLQGVCPRQYRFAENVCKQTVTRKPS